MSKKPWDGLNILLGALLALWLLAGCASSGDTGRAAKESCGSPRALPSPDGSKIILARPAGRFCAIYTVADDGSDIHGVPAPGTNASRMTPSYSPDGRQIAFTQTADGDRTHIHVMNADGTDIRQVTHSEHADTYPAFSPDGSQIVFARAHRHRTDFLARTPWVDVDVYVVSLDGTGEQRLTQESFYDMSPPYFSPDGTDILFAASPASANSPNRRVYRVDVKSRTLHALTDGSSFDFDPVFSPDGSTIAFMSSRGQDRSVPGGYEVWTMDRTGANARELTHARQFFMLPYYFPDGRSLLVVKELPDNVHHEIWRMDADGKNLRRIAGPEVLSGP